MKPPRGQSKAVDPQQVRERLARAAAATEEALGLSPERAEAVLRERARALARPSAAAPRAGDFLEVIVFRLAGESYAIESHFVREVVRQGDCTPLPGAPDF